VALPMLVVSAILVGWFGGALVADLNRHMDIPFRVFYTDMQNIVVLSDVANGVFKSFCFALIIGVVSCHQGLNTIGGPRGIGRSVTKAVVNSIAGIVIFDYILTRLLLK
jgi:phospholipid/cholesterol/gamma-HCH transport system permease protein